MTRAGMRRALPAASGLIAVAFVLGGCSDSDPREGLPAEWWSTRLEPAGDMMLHIEPDGSARLENVPIWNGQGDCESVEPELYSGDASWTWDKGFELVLPDGRSAIVLGRAHFGETLWSEVGVLVCGRDSSADRLHFLLGGGPNGELEEPLDG